MWFIEVANIESKITYMSFVIIIFNLSHKKTASHTLASGFTYIVLILVFILAGYAL